MTQVHIRGYEMNSKDGLLKRIKDPRALETVLTDFKPLPGSKIGELTANFDVVMEKPCMRSRTGNLASVAHQRFAHIGVYLVESFVTIVTSTP